MVGSLIHQRWAGTVMPTGGAIRRWSGHEDRFIDQALTQWSPKGSDEPFTLLIMVWFSLTPSQADEKTSLCYTNQICCIACRSLCSCVLGDGWSFVACVHVFMCSG